MCYIKCRKETSERCHLGKKREKIMRSTAMMREMNMRRFTAYDRGMSIFPCAFMPRRIMRSGGSLMNG